jgi:hypothetical protein
MSLALLNCKIALGGYNISGVHNSLTVDYGAEMLDDTVFGTSGTRSNKPGLKTVGYTGGGFVDFGVSDEPMFNRIGAIREVMSFAYDGETEGDPVYFVRGVNGNYNPLTGEVGALVPFEFTAASANTPLVRGKTLGWGEKAAAGNTALGHAFPLVGTGGVAYAALHVFEVGTDVSVTIESGTSSGMGAPTARFTFPVVTQPGAYWMEMDGPIATDTFWRAVWTPSGGAASIWVVFGTL